MKFFDLVYVMTKGGPGRSTEIVGTYIFELAFRVQRVGYASGAALILLVIILCLTYAIMRIREQQ
jgi:raffinose/stachyose/melibiose transport system permease protein